MGKKPERALTVYLTISKIQTQPQTLPRKHQKFRMTFSKNTFGKLLLVFQLFRQFDLEIQYFIFKFQKLFFERIYKNGYTFLHLLKSFYECSFIMLGPWLKFCIDLLNLNGGIPVVGCGEICRIIMIWYTEFVLKYFWYCLRFDFRHKDKVI